MNTKKFSSCMIMVMLVSSGIGLMASDNAQAAFIENLAPLPNGFIPYDTAWNDAGTMAVVVGYNSTGGANAFAYWPNNDTYTPISGGGNGQSLHAADYFNQPIYDWPNVLLVDADWAGNDLISFYSDAFDEIKEVYVDIWDVWDNPTENQGKPTAEDMAEYDLVVWIPSRNMDGMAGGGDALNPTDIAEISTYLDGGGNFFISNIYLLNYYWTLMDPGEFINDYLGTNGYGNTDYEFYARPVPSDAAFDGLGISTQDWNVYGWTEALMATRILWTGLGTYCFQGSYDTSSWVNTGVRYDSGTFKTIFFGFPLETLPGYYASNLMEMALDWYCPPSPIGLDQSNEYIGNSMYIDVGIDTEPWAQAFVPQADSISGVEFFMYSETSGTDYFCIELVEDNGNQPSGDGLTYGYIYAADIPVGSANADWVKCTFFDENVSLLPGNTYWITCSRYSESYSQMWMVDNSGSYEYGEVQGYNGMTWDTFSYDFLFRTYQQSESQTITIYPSKDNTIYGPTYSSNSNGAGQYLLAGLDWSNEKTRALMEYDIIGNIPEFSTITDVNVSMYCCNMQEPDAYETWLYPLNYEWGESTSDGENWEPYGATAQTGDATWVYRYKDTDFWMSPGGDFGSISGYEWVELPCWYSWTDSSLSLDVQYWLDNPTENHGWILIGSEGISGSTRWFYSGDSADPAYWPRITVTYAEPTIIGYEDTFWMAGDNGGAPPANCYNLVPSDEMVLNPMNEYLGFPSFYSMAVDDMGNPLCAGVGLSYMYYYDGSDWHEIPDDLSMLSNYQFDSIDFNPNDRRFYAVGIDHIFYTDTAPLDYTKHCYEFNYFTGSGDDINSIAWNELFDYGLVADTHRIMKVWPYGEYGNGTIRYQVVNSSWYNYYYDLSWDPGEWNEAGIVGTSSTTARYWRYYNSNPQLIDGYERMGAFLTCAMKPPSSPTWLFIPSGGGSIQVNIQLKDQSGEITVNVNMPLLFELDMWKQVDPGMFSVFNESVDANTTYTFFIEGNYTKEGVDYWNAANMHMNLTAWFDHGEIGNQSSPGNPMKNNRTRQFRLTYSPGTSLTMMFPVSYPNEFSIYDYYEDPASYGADGFTHRVYINVTFGPQTVFSNSSLAAGSSMNKWDKNFALNDAYSWDLQASLVDNFVSTARNDTYEEFGVKKYASIASWGSPGGSIPPGAAMTLASPSYISYSINSPYTLNVSIPNLVKDGNPAQNITADNVQVNNTHFIADGFNSEIPVWTAFAGPSQDWCIWGQFGAMLQPVGNGTVSAGSNYSDFTGMDMYGMFDVTEVWWRVTVPVSTQEGVYRATITITLWS